MLLLADQKYLKVKVVDGVAVVTFDNPGEKVNTINATVLDEIKATMDFINKEDQVKAGILISGKPECFVAGADINILEETEDEEFGRTISIEGQETFQRIEDCKKPLIAGINGACFGGGN